jgi:AcrR family transcriptional regulator
MASDDAKTGAGSNDVVSARERILSAAYELFSRRGTQSVGIDAIITHSGVARQTLYRHFPSKQALVLAFLERRDRLWTRGWLQHEVEQRAADPAQRLLAIFDVLDEWFRTPEYEGCSFINVLLATADTSDPVHRAGASYLAGVRNFLEEQARRAGIADAEPFARSWHLLMNGAIVAAHEGDHDAARRAKRMGASLLEHELGLAAAMTA